MAHVPVDLITIVEFSVFDSEFVDRHTLERGLIEKPFYNCTPEQCCEYIWKNIWETAVIKKITEYHLHEDSIKHINVTAIKNKLDHSKGR